MAYAPPTTPASYWKPGAMSLPAVSYPGAPSTSRPRALPTQVQRRGDGRPAISPEEAFGVNTGQFSAINGWNNAGPLTVPVINRGTVGGGGGAGGVGDLASQFQSAMDKANQANEARYQDILGGYQSRYERALDLLKGSGDQERADINEAARNREAMIRQQMVGSGLGNSSVLQTMMMGADRERNNDLGRLNDRLRQQQLAADTGLSADTLQFMERKTEQAPDYRMLADLAQGVGAAGGGIPMGGDGGGSGQGQGSQSQGWFNPFMAMFSGGYAQPSNRTQARRDTRAAQREDELWRRMVSRASIPSAPRSSPSPAWMTSYEYTPGVS